MDALLARWQVVLVAVGTNYAKGKTASVTHVRTTVKDMQGRTSDGWFATCHGGRAFAKTAYFLPAKTCHENNLTISADALHWAFVCQSLPKIQPNMAARQKEKPHLNWGFSRYDHGGRGGI